MYKALGRVMMKANAFRAVLSAIAKGGLHSDVRKRTFDEESGRMLMDRDLGPLPWPVWMQKHRYEQRIREAKELRV